MEEKLPIKFFTKRDEDKQRVEGGGDKKLPKWVLEGNALYERSLTLLNCMGEILEEENWEERKIPVIVQAKLNKDAHAKSHRKKIENIFFTDKNNVIGVADENTLIVRVDSQNDGIKIKKNIIDKKNNAYGISGIEDIIKYKPNIYKADNISNYKLKLFNFRDFSVNQSNKIKFEKLLKSKKIDYIKTNYTKSLIIYKLCNMSGLMINELMNDTLFDLTEEFVPMPAITMSLDSLDINRSFTIKDYDDSKKSEVVGILDNGICRVEPLRTWIYGERNSPYPDDLISEEHGTFIAGIIVYGDELQGEEFVGSKNIRVFDAAVFPNTNKERIEEDELIENIREVIKNNHQKIKIWNLSISIMREISDQKFSDFGIALDDIQDEYNVLICKSAGNCKKFSVGGILERLNEGADSVRSLVVGSIADKKKGLDISEPYNLSPFSRRGPGLACIIKPDIVHFGGNAGIDESGRIVQGGVKSFSKEGNVIEQAGTSFSTPRVAALAAGLLNEMDEEFDALLLKGLIIHSANYPSNLEIPEVERTKYLGFGLPNTVHNILYNSPNEATLILRDVLPKGKFIDIKDFPIPDCLIKDGYYNFQVVVTLVYDPILDATQGFEYCQSNIDVKFGSYDEKIDRDTSKNCILNPVGRAGAKNVLKGSLYSKVKMKESSEDFALKERMLIQYGDKYYPVKKYAVDLSELTEGNKLKYTTSNKKWYLTIDSTYRSSVEDRASINNEELSQEFCLIITIKDSSNTCNVYNGITQKLDEYNFWHSNIKISEKISINI
ncbi:S8 family peptidase [Fusobacterium necrophorum]|uniref:S8 family peptidase n=1 Tax=Fusobacterium necrophorum TaxID=859 RepID=UPI00254D5C8F|nr:S8 family peptidase [Fusobacterium necrophorum]MDK4483525.1 S8 family peptidase [Fusobacterium necrophorum]MDK4499946.1 S8 family peptidase [Fusobacterium necrophorum]MDK4507952.1 S8 family peptidase [Fusobacterium necrophorum]